jgi:hypothetical protein
MNEKPNRAYSAHKAGVMGIVGASAQMEKPTNPKAKTPKAAGDEADPSLKKLYQDWDDAFAGKGSTSADDSKAFNLRVKNTRALIKPLNSGTAKKDRISLGPSVFAVDDRQFIPKKKPTRPSTATTPDPTASAQASAGLEGDDEVFAALQNWD